MKTFVPKMSVAKYCALLLFSGGLASADSSIRTVDLNGIRQAPMRNGRPRALRHVAPAGGSGFAQNAPTSIVSAGITALGIYNNPSDANGGDWVTDFGGPRIVTTQLQLIFWGSAWRNAVNPSIEGVKGAVEKILAGPYLSQMGQYGYQSVTVGGVTLVTSPDPSANYKDTDPGDLVWNLIDQGKFPEPDQGGRFLYMVFMPPGTTPPSPEVGAHGAPSERDFPFVDVDYAWVGWVSYGALDKITKVFGHELVEAISDPEPGSAAWIMNRNLNGGNEIGDACNNTVDVLDGMDMQAYWSKANRACVLPLGSGRPEIKSLSQTTGPVSGNTKVVINGRLFLKVSKVTFGGIPATFTTDSPFQITAISPRFDTAISANVQVTTPFGGSMETQRFNFYPIVTSITPSAGPIEGKQGVMVNGLGLSTPGNPTTITFGGVPSPNVYCYDGTHCSAATPPSGAGTVHVLASAGGGISLPTAADLYTYIGPTITKVDPNVGDENGNTQVTVSGISLKDTMTWRVGETVVKAGCFTATQCEIFTPKGTGVVNISVEFNNVRSASTPDNQFTYRKFPAVAGVVPASGPATGGTLVTIVGANFATGPGATRIDFGPNNPAANVQCTPTQCTATTPAGVSIVDVTMSVGGLTSSKLLADRFSYGPVVKSVTPNSGSERGGTKVTITGAGFASTQFGSSPLVYFGSNLASSFQCSPATCIATSPSGAGTVDVHVSVDSQPGTATAAGRFTYTRDAASRGWTHWNVAPLSMETPPDAMTYDTLHHQVLATVPQIGAPITLWVWNQASNGWQAKDATAGLQNWKSAFAFDEANGMAVLFGGLVDSEREVGDITRVTYKIDNSTWIWDGTAWTPVNPPVKPPARYQASMTYDPVRKKIVLFGGCGQYPGCQTQLNDTWTWDGSNWMQESPSVSPPPRSHAFMAYDPAAGNTILFGGASGKGSLADTWAWDGKNWTQLHPSSSPSAREGGGLAYSAADSGLVLYGGSGPSATLSDTWLWNGTTWTLTSPANIPQVGSLISGMVYNPVANFVVMMGDFDVWTWGGQ